MTDGLFETTTSGRGLLVAVQRIAFAVGRRARRLGKRVGDWRGAGLDRPPPASLDRATLRNLGFDPAAADRICRLVFRRRPLAAAIARRIIRKVDRCAIDPGISFALPLP